MSDFEIIQLLTNIIISGTLTGVFVGYGIAFFGD